MRHCPRGSPASAIGPASAIDPASTIGSGRRGGSGRRASSIRRCDSCVCGSARLASAALRARARAGALGAIGIGRAAVVRVCPVGVLRGSGAANPAGRVVGGGGCFGKRSGRAGRRGEVRECRRLCTLPFSPPRAALAEEEPPPVRVLFLPGAPPLEPVRRTLCRPPRPDRARGA